MTPGHYFYRHSLWSFSLFHLLSMTELMLHVYSYTFSILLKQSLFQSVSISQVVTVKQSVTMSL